MKIIPFSKYPNVDAYLETQPPVSETMRTLLEQIHEWQTEAYQLGLKEGAINSLTKLRSEISADMLAGEDPAAQKQYRVLLETADNLFDNEAFAMCATNIAEAPADAPLGDLLYAAMRGSFATGFAYAYARIADQKAEG